MQAFNGVFWQRTKAIELFLKRIYFSKHGITLGKEKSRQGCALLRGVTAMLEGKSRTKVVKTGGVYFIRFIC